MKEPEFQTMEQKLSHLQRAAAVYATFAQGTGEKMMRLLVAYAPTVKKKYGQDTVGYINEICYQDFEKGPVDCLFPEWYSRAMSMSKKDVEVEQVVDSNPIKVRVVQMIETHRLTYWVWLENTTIKIYKESYITPWYFENPDYANDHAVKLAAVLGITPVLWMRQIGDVNSVTAQQ